MAEFTCPGCGEPMSRTPADHEVELDNSGATICSNGVRPAEWRVDIYVPPESYRMSPYAEHLARYCTGSGCRFPHHRPLFT